ncbi:odorant receptor 88a-like [Drosophila busckii]|uniref:odorant receptor 88a-like n=1 Tax=Drosophila busckii TaxID=30019 RepID=UPI00083F41B7|nr:odorant receptor 88a-like [Drosophila busckii]
MYKVDQAYANFLKRYSYVKAFTILALTGFACAPVVMYILTYEDRHAPILLDHQILGGWLPFDLRQNHYVYPLVWAYDVISTVTGAAFFSSFDTIFNAVQAQLIMHYDCLCRNIKDINVAYSVTSNDEQQFYVELGYLIERHQHLNALVNHFNTIVRGAIFSTHLVGATSICFHLYLITESQDLLMIGKYVIPTLVLVVFTFEICLRGAQLEEANWYMGSRKYRRLILMWLKYAQLTKNVNAYGMVKVNMVHFSEIMKLAYRLFAFLKSN